MSFCLTTFHMNLLAMLVVHLHVFNIHCLTLLAGISLEPSEPVVPPETLPPHLQTTTVPPPSKPVKIFIKRLSEETPVKAEHHLEPLPPITAPAAQVRI